MGGSAWLGGFSVSPAVGKGLCLRESPGTGRKNPAAKPEGKNWGLFAVGWRPVGRGAELHPGHHGDPAPPTRLQPHTMRYFKIISALMNCRVAHDCS